MKKVPRNSTTAKRIRRQLALSTESFSAVISRIMTEAQDMLGHTALFDKDYDDFALSKPFAQRYLTLAGCVTDAKVDFSGFAQVPAEQINTRNMYECFHGILAYIFFKSGNKFNTRELSVRFSSASQREDMNSAKLRGMYTSQGYQRLLDTCDIASVFDYTDIGKVFQVPTVKEAFFGVSFERITVNPVAYAIRSGELRVSREHLVSFVFDAYDMSSGTWDVLDERANINDLIPSGGYKLFFVRTTGKHYADFRIRQTDTSSSNFWGFSMAAFDIHGYVRYKDGAAAEEREAGEEVHKSAAFDAFESFGSIDMRDFL